MPGDQTPSYDVERQGDTLIVTPLVNMGEFECALQQPIYRRLEREVEASAGKSGAVNVVFDLHRTSYFGSSAVDFLVKVWKLASRHGGRFAVCGLSDIEREILEITKLDTLWAIHTSRADAVQALDDSFAT